MYKHLPFKKGTTPITIMQDGWARDLPVEQTLEELHTMGHTFVTMYTVKLFREAENALYADFCTVGYT